MMQGGVLKKKASLFSSLFSSLLFVERMPSTRMWIDDRPRGGAWELGNEHIRHVQPHTVWIFFGERRESPSCVTERVNTDGAIVIGEAQP